VKQLVWKVAVALVRLLPARVVQSLATLLVQARAESLPHDEALRLLFGVDAALYPAQGDQAVAYGGGTHTKHRHMRYHDFFVDRIGAGDRVLDVGCGIGALAHSIASRAGAQVVAIDIEQPKIEQARREYSHPRLEYVVGDATAGVPGDDYSVVVLSNVLEHLRDRPRFVRTVLDNVGAPRALIRVPLFERDWRVPLKRELGVEWRLDTTHETEYTLESFREEMDEAGVEIAEQQVRWGEIWADVRRSQPG
jgi:SAM-dependent methyltransferase